MFELFYKLGKEGKLQMPDIDVDMKGLNVSTRTKQEIECEIAALQKELQNLPRIFMLEAVVKEDIYDQYEIDIDFKEDLYLTLSGLQSVVQDAISSAIPNLKSGTKMYASLSGNTLYWYTDKLPSNYIGYEDEYVRKYLTDIKSIDEDFFDKSKIEDLNKGANNED